MPDEEGPEPYWYEDSNVPEDIPDSGTILELVNVNELLKSFAYPPDADTPVCWVKYGVSVHWNEVCAQKMACEGLRATAPRIARAPAIYYAFMYKQTTVIVMEYVRGQTAKDLYDKADEAGRAVIRTQLADAFSALTRIPLPVDKALLRPTAIDGGYAGHRAFGDLLDFTAPRLYENATQLEEHINVLLEKASPRTSTQERYKWRLQHLADEPLVFSHMDAYGKNFLIDTEGCVVVLDFFNASILPASFALSTVQHHMYDIRIGDLVVVPGARTENVRALGMLYTWLQQGGGFDKMGKRVAGGDDETQTRLIALVQNTLK
ncbi:Aminoglycoside phosphotransferase [Niveomyces insectorum RCEF 264]|uniref:Aminoglycoside phosphotransferase n=1 Tax=Niveomyces insectorum RCEF 264 TaxID=1081102 RepID=A0A167PR42_9HYPO|nr:Aminoglycoside phosphotransferase [Niveomyces insectorum RCEF 264]